MNLDGHVSHSPNIKLILIEIMSVTQQQVNNKEKGGVINAKREVLSSLAPPKNKNSALVLFNLELLTLCR